MDVQFLREYEIYLVFLWHGLIFELVLGYYYVQVEVTEGAQQKYLFGGDKECGGQAFTPWYEGKGLALSTYYN